MDCISNPFEMAWIEVSILARGADQAIDMIQKISLTMAGHDDHLFGIEAKPRRFSMQALVPERGFDPIMTGG
jgi:hypothetical protein